ncbi:MAG: hypothetical protein Q9160_004525 [Pyrenula sp. 1 TL-2023]
MDLSIYGAIWATALCIVVVGVAAEKNPEKVPPWPFFVFWSIFIVQLGILIYRNLKNEIDTLIHSTGYLLCSSLILWFLSASLGVKSTSIPNYIPVSVSTGILLMLSIEQLGMSCLKHRNRYATWIKREWVLLKSLVNELLNEPRSPFWTAGDLGTAEEIRTSRDDEPVPLLTVHQELGEGQDLMGNREVIYLDVEEDITPRPPC